LFDAQIDALLEELSNAWAKDPGVKSIVFSQFTQFLDLAEWCLQRNGWERGLFTTFVSFLFCISFNFN
jgi:SNF2 family DNA or RNA helicase